MGTCQSIPTGPEATTGHRSSSNNKPQQLDLASHTTDGLHISEELGRSSDPQDEPTTHPILLEIEQYQKKTAAGNMGRVLDAGTGFSSLNWLRHLLVHAEEFGVTGWTAVTACESMAKDLQEYAQVNGMNQQHGKVPAVESGSTTSGLLLGNWFDKDGEDSDLLEGELYDTILIDYLIGSIDGYTPYLQDCIFQRLLKHLKPGGRVYLTGLEPIPEKEQGPADILCQTKRIRDACILLAGDRCYREYPLKWVLRNLERTPLNIVEHKTYPLRHSMSDIDAQLQLAKSKLSKIGSKSGNEGLASMMRETIALVERKARVATRSLPGHCIPQGMDYLVIAELPE